MAINFGEQFRLGKDDLTYKGVHLRGYGRKRGAEGTVVTYGFSSWSPQQRSRNWGVDIRPPLSLTEARKTIDSYLKQGYTVHPNGHLRAPGWPYDD